MIDRTHPQFASMIEALRAGRIDGADEINAEIDAMIVQLRAEHPVAVA